MLAVVVGFRLQAAGRVDDALFVAIVLVATSLGVVVPVLKDAGKLGPDLGQLVVAAASVADFGAVILLSLFFSRVGGAGRPAPPPSAASPLRQSPRFVVLLGLGRSMVFTRLCSSALQDTTAQIRVRAASSSSSGSARSP